MKLFKTAFLALILAVVSGCSSPNAPSGPLLSQRDPSPYLTQVYAYTYGPGQHGKLIPAGLAEGRKILGETQEFVRLGGWGGFVTAGFDHPVPNCPGYDLAVVPQGGTGQEPAVVFVASDDNGNGLPDDPWLELTGSETGKDYGPQDSYVRKYRVTYQRPPEGQKTILWTDSLGAQGEIVPGFGEGGQTWWWSGYAPPGDTLTLEGVLLPKVKREIGGVWNDLTGRFLWGYGENYGAGDMAPLTFAGSVTPVNRFDLDDAVDSEGRPAVPAAVRFLKIQSGVFQTAGPLNEMSPEIKGAVDLSLVQP